MSNDKRSERVQLVMRFLHQSPSTPHTVTEVAEALELNVMSTRYTMRRDFPECFIVDETTTMGRCVYSLSGEWPSHREFDIDDPIQVIVVTREKRMLGQMPGQMPEEPEQDIHLRIHEQLRKKMSADSDEAEATEEKLKYELANLRAELQAQKELAKAKELPVGDRMQREDEVVKYGTGREPKGWVYNREAINFLDRIFMMARNVTYVEVCRNLTADEAYKLNVVGKTITYSLNKLIHAKIIGTDAQKEWTII